VVDITHTGGSSGFWFGTYPLPPLPLWDSVVLDCIRSYESDSLPVAFAEKVEACVLPSAMEVVWPHGNLHFEIPFTHPQSKLKGLELGLSIENRDVFLGFSYHPTYDEKDNPAIIHGVEEMIRLLDLPLAIEVKGELCFLKHTSRDGVIFRPKEGTNVPGSSVKCNLPGFSVEEAVLRFRKMLKAPGLKMKDGIWHTGWLFQSPQPKRPAGVL